MTSNENKMADLPGPCAQALSSYILVPRSIVTQRNVRGEERCVTKLKTAARETNNNAAEGGKSIKY